MSDEKEVTYKRKVKHIEAGSPSRFEMKVNEFLETVGGLEVYTIQYQVHIQSGNPMYSCLIDYYEEI